MTKFVIGDVVECVDDYTTGLTLNNKYLIRRINERNLVEVRCDDGYHEFYFSNRFILADEENE